MNALKKWWIWLLAGLIVLASIGAYIYWSKKNANPEYRTAKIEKGALTASVAASGTLSPVVSVQVGSQVSGQLKEVLVDFNSLVKKGELIARIDPETFEYRVRQAQADVDAAQAQVLMQQAIIAAQRAGLSQAEVTWQDARRDFERKEQLRDKNFISGADVDKARATANVLAEQVKAAQAQVEVAKATANNVAAAVKQREALLAQARVDLARTEIRAPVNGIVIKRSVDKGQTVAASLQAPELFIIAENLTDMRVDTSIDESEIGKIKLGQKATFTVDAFPGKQFEGKVQQIRKAALTVSNVVTYLVEVSASNPELLLLPGMTANVRIVTDIRENILKVSNAALRFRPPSSDKEKNKDGGSGGKSRGPRSSAGAGGMPVSARLYNLQDGKLVAIPVTLGATDGQMTEVSAAQLQEGLEIVTGTNDSGDKRKSGSSSGGGPRMF
jgi:HlyD family secretion protein